MKWIKFPLNQKKLIQLKKPLLNVADKVNLKRSSKYVPLSNLSIYYTRKITKCSTKFELSDGSYSVQFIQDYLEYIIKKHETIADDPPIQIYINKIEKKLHLKLYRNYLEFLSRESLQLLGGTKKKVTKNKNGEML